MLAKVGATSNSIHMHFSSCVSYQFLAELPESRGCVGILCFWGRLHWPALVQVEATDPLHGGVAGTVHYGGGSLLLQENG